jgi:hypothetical protein
MFETSVLKCTGAVNKRPLNVRMDTITERKTYQFVLLTSYSQGIKEAVCVCVCGGGGGGLEGNGK